MATFSGSVCLPASRPAMHGRQNLDVLVSTAGNPAYVLGAPLEPPLDAGRLGLGFALDSQGIPTFPSRGFHDQILTASATPGSWWYAPGRPLGKLRGLCSSTLFPSQRCFRIASAYEAATNPAFRHPIWPLPEP